MFAEGNGKGDEDHDRVKARKAVEMEIRRLEMMKRSANKQRLRQIHIERREAQQAEEIRQAKETSEVKARQIERTQRLAEELARRKHTELQEAIKQKKIKLAAQSLSSCTLQNIEAVMLKEKECEKQSSKLLEGLWYHAEDTDKKHQFEKKLSYRRELQNQMIDNRRRLREREEEKHRDRKILEEVGETIRRQDVEARKLKEETALALQAERDAFLKARQFWKDKRREALKQEHLQISRIVAEKETLRKKMAEEQTDIRSSKDAMVDRLAKKMVDEEHRKMEREEICRELYLAEKENELVTGERKLALRKRRTATELLQDMVRHKKAVAEKRAKEDAIDAAFARYLAEERRALDEKEKRKEQERREKGIRYGNELRETIARNRMQCAKSAVQTEDIANGNSKKEDPDTCSKNRKVKCLSESVFDAWKSREQRNMINA